MEHYSYYIRSGEMLFHLHKYAFIWVHNCGNTYVVLILIVRSRAMKWARITLQLCLDRRIHGSPSSSRMNDLYTEATRIFYWQLTTPHYSSNIWTFPKEADSRTLTSLYFISTCRSSLIQCPFRGTYFDAYRQLGKRARQSFILIRYEFCWMCQWLDFQKYIRIYVSEYK